MKSLLVTIPIFFVFSVSSQIIEKKTFAEGETIADSMALVQIYNALGGSNWSPAVNWTTASLSDWEGIILNGEGRVKDVDLSNFGAVGNMPNPFTGDAVGGLSAIETFDVAENQISGLMDFSGTTITDLDVSGNSLHFDDLEPLIEISILDYSNQSSIQFDQVSTIPHEIRYGDNFNLSLTMGGSDNHYQWKRNGVDITTNTYFMDNGDNLEIIDINYDNMGEFTVEVTSPTLVAGLAIDVDPQLVLAIEDLEVQVVDSNGQPISENVTGALFDLFGATQQKGFDTLAVAWNETSIFTIPDVVLGNYLLAVSSNPEKYIDTYFGDGFLWRYADTLDFRSDDPVFLSIIEIPPPETPIGTAVVSVILESNFEDEPRRRMPNVKCGLLRKETHEGGRGTDSSEDYFDLVAYSETNSDGELKFGFLPNGVYRFFIECPGVQLDPYSVEFEIAEVGRGGSEFILSVFLKEEGIEVDIKVVPGVIVGESEAFLKAFENLQIYPNPSSDVLNISYSHLTTYAVKVELADLTGAILHHQNLQRGYDRDLIIDVSAFEEGVYILRFYDTESPAVDMISYQIIVRD
ncbi:MAG: T9SS type A sorting domain-containing protein [Ekhidna sp.]